MKQTNNAIKFLMAQYRAIFRNANLKMFLAAATAAAAMAATSAQAAADNGDYWVNLTDSTLTSEKVVEANGAKNAKNNFELTIGQAGKLVLGGDAQGKGTYGLTASKTGTINVDGGALEVGKGKPNGAEVTLTNLNVKNGSAHIGDATAEASSLSAGSIVIGAAAAPQEPVAPAAKAATAKVVIGKNGSISATGDTAVFTINQGGELAFTKDATAAASKATAAKGISLNGGAISVANSGSATIEGAINSNGGVITVGGDGSQATSLEVKGNVAFAGEGGSLTIAKQGTFKVTSADKDVSLKLGNATVTNAGKVDFGTLAANKSATLTVSADQYANLFAGAVEATGADTSKFNLNVVGDTEIDLDTILNDGALDNKKIKLTTAKLGKLQVDNATYAAEKIEQEGEFSFGTLTAGKSNALTLSGSSVVNVSQDLNVNGGVENGVLTINTATLNLNGTGAEHTVAAKEIKLEDGSAKEKAQLNVKGGTWSANNLNIVMGTASVDSGSTLVINGELTTTAQNGLIDVKNASTLDASAATKITLGAHSADRKNTIDVTGGSTLELKQDQVFTVNGDAVALTTGANAGSKVDASSIKTDETSRLLFVTEQGFKLNQKQLDSLITTLGGADSQLKGFISFGDDFKLDGMSGDSIELDKVTNADVYGGMTGTTATGNVDKSVMIGNIQVTTDDGTVTIADGKTAVLTGADKNGNLVSNNKGTTDVAVGNGSKLTLAAGNAGKIDGVAAGNGDISFGHSKTRENAGSVTVESIGAKNGVASVTVARGDVVVTGKPSEGETAVKLQTGKLSLAVGTSLKAEGHEISVTAANDKPTSIMGNLTAKSLAFTQANAELNIAGDAVVDLDSLTLASNATGKIQLGMDDVNGSSGTLEVGKLTLNGGSLVVDPDWGKGVAIAAVKELSGKDTNTDAQILDGNIAVGLNSVAGIGFSSRAEVESLLNSYGYLAPVDGSDKADLNKEKGLQAALVLNTPIKVVTGKGVLIAPDKKGADLANVPQNEFNLGANGALVVNDSVYKRGADGKLQGSAVTLENGNMGSVKADTASKVILAGAFSKNDTGIKVFENANGSAPITGGSEVAAETANGILAGKIGTNGQLGALDFKDEAAKKAFDSFYSASSAPVRDLLKKSFLGETALDLTQAGAKFVLSVANDSNDHSGLKADAAAHAATYAGAQVAAVAAVGTMAEAVGGHVGSMGVEATAIDATGSAANGGVWVSPMYKSVDADGFNAEGATYGADVDLAGVAFGTDTVNGNMRFGAVFNIGSGDSEGKGNGTGLKDEFDYYGFGMYTAMGFGNFALVGDASLNVISHDVKHAGLDAKGSADTTAVTMGVTGQYTISNPAVDVTPHLGARFIRLDTDSYDLVAGGDHVATTDFDVQNVFSIPLGVTLSKAFEMGGWSLAPSADLSITFNTGDTDAKSTTQFTGVKAIDLTTEVLDEVTYGVAVGLGAQYGAFGTQIGLNYTGSSNTDSFGVNAQARYMF